MFLRRKRTARNAEQFIRIRISSETPDAYKDGHREFLLTVDQAHDLLIDLHKACAPTLGPLLSIREQLQGA